ncbi:MAG: PKD domain-containing protein [Bacteroidota bacterium]
MKRLLRPLKLRLIAILVLLLICRSAYATHLVGMDLYYTWVSGNTYKITLVAYADCGAASSAFAALPTNTPVIYIYNGGTLVDDVILNIEPPSAGVEITPVCPAYLALTQCTDPSFDIPGIKKFVYSTTYTLPGTSPVWRFLFTGKMDPTSFIAGRAPSITNISGTSYTELVDTLNNTTVTNSSPTFTNLPTPFFCVNNDNNYNPGAVDPNADSLRFFLVAGKAGTASSAAGPPVTYVSPFTATNPLAVAWQFFDQATGQINFYPNALQRSLVVYNVREFRGGNFVGSCQREMTFLVQTCTYTPPSGGLTGATNGTITDSTHFRICRDSGPFSMSIYPHEASGTTNITVTVSGLPAGLSFTTTGNGTPSPHCTIAWTSTGTAPGSYTFFVTYKSSSCPLAATQTIAYTLTILPQPTLSYTLLSAANCFAKAAISIIPGGGGFTTVKVSNATAPYDTIQTFASVSAAFTDSLPAGSYHITIRNSSGCKATIPVTLAAPAVVVPTATFVSPTYCGATDGSIKLYHLIPGTSDTIRFYRNGILQPALYLPVASDSTITITGLIAGVYSSITVKYGRYCISAPIGPFTLVNPPFTMRAVTYTNPTYCGACDGTIKLWGLRPGQWDTITYIKDGITQPPVVAFIGPDSTVTITGRCQGVYVNFVARTAGACVSNSLGPVTLSAPPFTMRAITFTNPTYCGLCNGTIKLWGLRPGQWDTVTYIKDGITQPPVAALVGADSTITITGLCQGLYVNFVARTAGVCVSNVLGPVTLTVPPFTMRTITYTNPSYCGICNGTIKLYGLHPGQTDTITYLKDGIAQPPLVVTIAADSIVTISGLCAGVYSNFIARTAGVCVSNTLGPVTLTVPPFTMRALTFTNPSYCGICNGTIKLWGLFPGQTDTITYTKGGVPQTPLVFVVGADSTITITGLCAGLYDNFIARTGGICVSNTLGPANLTVPPFTMRALTFTNPDYCGTCNGTIKLWGLYPGQTDTIYYTKNGIAQPPLSFVVAADSTITLTGLCEGLYDNFVARTGGVCVSNTLGPANLTVPPFTMRALSFTNPPYCGICTGTITLYGLHPGQTDTVTYTKDGVAQTPVVFLIGTDSQAVFTGLCAGLYDNFVAHTGGVCISNTLGPANLTVPPFTMGSISFTHPTKCGFCDGVITLHGLYPGQVDTIHYKFNGVAQTPIPATVSAGGNIVLTGLCEGLYSDFVARTGGVCVSNTLGPVTLDAPPIIPGFNFVNHEHCEADTVVFTNTSSPAGDLTYVWDFGDSTTSTLTNPVHIYTLPGTYTVKLIISNTMCVDSIIKTVAINNIVKAGFTAVPDSFVCTDRPVVFTNTSLGTLLKYRWDFGDGTKDTARDVTHVYTNTGVYNVVMALSNYVPCYDTVSIRLEVDSISAISVAVTDSIFCDGLSSTFTGVFATMGNTGYRWTLGDGTIIDNVNPLTHSFENGGTFTVNLEAFYRACPDTSASRTISIHDHPSLYLGPDTAICPGSTAFYLEDRINAGNPEAKWRWSTGSTTSQAVITAPGTYYATVNIGGCTSTDSVTVKQDCYIAIPNVFTPNGDGVNDYFFPRPLLAKGLAAFKMEIYNRWGQLIFSTDNVEGRGWDGKFNDVPQPTGVFVYTIEAVFKDGQREQHQGNVTLMR